MNVLVTGASGFVGNHVVEALQAAGHTISGLSRKAPNAERNRAGVNYYEGVDVADAATLKPQYFQCADAVVHLVGIIMERRPDQTFYRIHVDGTRNMVEAAKKAGVKRFVYLSAIGSAAGAEAEYSRTKFAAEELVRKSGIPFVILRPSIILGRDGEFVEQMKGLVHNGGLPIKLPFPVIPVPGNGKNRFQPIYIDDLTACVSRALTDDGLIGKTIEIGGATQVTFDTLLDTFAARENIRKPKLHAPIPILALAAPIVELLPNPPFSRDQLKNLKRDNVVEDISPMKQAFGFDPIGFDQAMDRIYGN